MTKDKPGLPDSQLAALRLILLPDNYEHLTCEEREFLRSEIVGEILEGHKYPSILTWAHITKGTKWTTQ